MSSEERALTPATPRRRASRTTTLPALPEQIVVPYANGTLGLRGLTLAEKVIIVTSSRAWHHVMDPVLADVEAERQARPGPAPSYSAAELEQAVLFQWMAGSASYSAARTMLAGDRHERDRELLGFDRPRRRVGRGLHIVRSLDSVPSESTIWRYHEDFRLNRRVLAYRRLFKELVKDQLADPEFREEARVLLVDGSAWLSHYSCFDRLNRQTGEVIRPATLEGGGYMPRSISNEGKDGHGYMMLTGTSPRGLPLTYLFGRLGYDSEKTLASELMNGHWKEHVAPHLDPDKINVWVADGGFNKPELRRDLRQLGLIDVCHVSSHSPGEDGEARNSVEERDGKIYGISGYPNWIANGHREIRCRCGSGRTIRRVTKDPASGRVISRVEGTCAACGPITITSGQWRLARNPRDEIAEDGMTAYFTRALSDTPEDKIEWMLGNPLTYHDPIAVEYGKTRFAQNEGFYGHMSRRFGLLRGKSWHRRRDAAERDALTVFCIMHSLALEQKRRVPPEAAGAGTIADIGPPGIAAA